MGDEQPTRHLRDPEKRVLEKLLSLARFELPQADALDRLVVQEMSDGGMGSLYLVHSSKSHASRRFGDRIADFQFDDEDGVPVLVSLNVDTDGDLFELDVWKVDFQPLISFDGAFKAD